MVRPFPSFWTALPCLVFISFDAVSASFLISALYCSARRYEGATVLEEMDVFILRKEQVRQLGEQELAHECKPHTVIR